MPDQLQGYTLADHIPIIYLDDEAKPIVCNCTPGRGHAICKKCGGPVIVVQDETQDMTWHHDWRH
jgi:hypothetical protein